MQELAVKEGETTPPKRYNSGSIILAMENAGQLIELEKKVDKHNNLVERTFRLEDRTELIDERIRVANHRIEDLEEVQKKCVHKAG